MGFRKHTQCEDVGNYSAVDWAVRQTFTDIGWGRKLFAAIALLIIGGWLLPAALVALLLTIIAYCNWWLYKRLICLGGDRCAIGLLVSVEPPAEKTGFDSLDTDYSLNLVLAPLTVGTVQPPSGNDGTQIDLMRQQPATANARVAGVVETFPFKGMIVKASADSAPIVYDMAVLHAEFEGGGVQKLKEAAEAALPFALLAAAACSIPIPLFTLVCLVLAAIAGVITVAGLAAALQDRGTPTDVNPKLDELHRHVDILFVRGEWVFDSAHEGWNEIHPIKTCLRIGAWRGTWESADEWVEHFDAWSRSSLPPDLPPPPPPSPPALPTALLTIAPTVLVGGKPAKGTIAFGAPLAAGGTVVLKSSDPAVVVPPSVAVGANQQFASFDVTTTVVPARRSVDVAATFGGATHVVTLVVRPAPTAAEWQTLVDGWCRLVRDATSPLTVSSQGRPQNQWTVHPVIDGCGPTDPPPPPPPPPLH